MSPYQYLPIEIRCPKWDRCSTRSCARPGHHPTRRVDDQLGGLESRTVVPHRNKMVGAEDGVSSLVGAALTQEGAWHLSPDFLVPSSMWCISPGVSPQLSGESEFQCLELPDSGTRLLRERGPLCSLLNVVFYQRQLATSEGPRGHSLGRRWP